MRKRQPFFTTGLATPDGNATVPPVDVIELKVCDFACAQAESDKEQNDCAIAQAGLTAACCHDPRDIFVVEKVWHWRQLPARKIRDGLITAGRATPSCDQETQECASGGHRHPCMSNAVHARASQHKLPDGEGAISLRRVTKGVHQVNEDVLISIQAAVRHPSISEHPIPKLAEDQPSFPWGRRLRLWLDNALLFEKEHKKGT